MKPWRAISGLERARNSASSRCADVVSPAAAAQEPRVTSPVADLSQRPGSPGVAATPRENRASMSLFHRVRLAATVSPAVSASDCTRRSVCSANLTCPRDD